MALAKTFPYTLKDFSVFQPQSTTFYAPCGFDFSNAIPFLKEKLSDLVDAC